MKKILIIAPPKSYHSKLHIQFSLQKNYSVYYLGFRDKWYPVKSTYFYGLNRLLPYRVNLILTWIKIRFAIVHIKPNIIHAHYMYPFCMFTFPGNNRTVLSLWGSDIRISYKEVNGLLRTLSNILMKNVKAVLVPGNYMRKYIPKYKNIQTTVWGIDQINTGKRNKRDRNYFEFKDNGIIITSIRINRKIFQIERIIKAIVQLHKIYPKIILNVIEGPYTEYNKQIRHASKGYDFINIFKHLKNEEYLKLLRASDIGISIAMSDAGPVSVKESMAIGLPVIFQRIEGIEETIKDMETGLGLSTMTVTELVKVIEKLILDKDLYNSISINAAKYSRNKFDRQTYFEEIYRIYRTIS